jgi:hypothetical protein
MTAGGKPGTVNNWLTLQRHDDGVARIFDNMHAKRA